MNKRTLFPNLSTPVTRINNGTIQGNSLRNGLSPSQLWGPVNPTYGPDNEYTGNNYGVPTSSGQLWGPVNPTYGPANRASGNNIF